MLQMESLVQVADNTGARTAKMIGVIGKATDQAHIGDIITCHIRESIPTASVKKGSVVKAVVVRTAAPIRRDDGSVLRFDSNAVVVIALVQILVSDGFQCGAVDKTAAARTANPQAVRKNVVGQASLSHISGMVSF